MKGVDLLEMIREAAVRLKTVDLVMQFDTLRYLRTQDLDKGIFLARTHKGGFNFCGMPVVEDISMPHNVVIFRDSAGKELGRLAGLRE